jgi:hypothetical protein
MNISRPSSLRWVRNINLATYNFVLEAWAVRNTIEHDTFGDPVNCKKEKIIEQLIWERNNMVEELQNNDFNADTEDLLKIPVTNLEMLLEQTKMRRNKKKNK